MVNLFDVLKNTNPKTGNKPIPKNNTSPKPKNKGPVLANKPTKRSAGRGR